MMWPQISVGEGTLGTGSKAGHEVSTGHCQIMLISSGVWVLTVNVVALLVSFRLLRRVQSLNSYFTKAL